MADEVPGGGSQPDPRRDRIAFFVALAIVGMVLLPVVVAWAALMVRLFVYVGGF